MEEYERAYKNRLLDIDALLAANIPRITAATHLGGVAIECRLKALVITYHSIKEWGEPSKRVGDPRFRVPIGRTSHGLISAVKLMSTLYKKAMADRHFLNHLSDVTYPTGSTVTDFIALRYSSHDLDGQALVNWKRSFDYVIGWLEKNEKLL